MAERVKCFSDFICTQVHIVVKAKSATCLNKGKARISWKSNTISAVSVTKKSLSRKTWSWTQRTQWHARRYWKLNGKQASDVRAAGLADAQFRTCYELFITMDNAKWKEYVTRKLSAWLADCPRDSDASSGCGF
jgi:hypothetical protein